MLIVLKILKSVFSFAHYCIFTVIINYTKLLETLKASYNNRYYQVRVARAQGYVPQHTLTDFNDFKNVRKKNIQFHCYH